MADRIPLVVDSSNYRIEELPVGDSLNLSGASILNASITGPCTVTGSTSDFGSPLLRITQTGSGNALLVEDDTHPDSTPGLVISGVGSCGIGTTIPSARFDIRLQSNAGFAYTTSPISQDVNDRITAAIFGNLGDLGNNNNIETQIGFTAGRTSQAMYTLGIKKTDSNLGDFYIRRSAGAGSGISTDFMVVVGSATSYRVGIGTTIPRGYFHISADLPSNSGVGTTTQYWRDSAFVVGHNGNIGLGTTGFRDVMNLNVFPLSDTANNNPGWADKTGRNRMHIYSIGESFIINETKHLAQGNENQFVAIAGTCKAQFGVLRGSGNTQPTGFLALCDNNAQDCGLWFDTSGNLRTAQGYSGTGIPFGYVGSTNGTVVGTQTSDERLKNVGIGVVNGLEKISQLNPVYYTLKDEPERNRIGFIAQEVQSVVPEAVYSTGEPIDDDGNPIRFNSLVGPGEVENPKLAMEYVSLIPVLVKAIQELKAEVDALKNA